MRRPIPSFAAPSEEPINYLNTTPLIDVMLVLLVMFIITIPVMNHKVPMDLPQGPRPAEMKPVIHSLELDAAGLLRLDGAPIGRDALPARLAAIRDEPVSDLLLRADAETPFEHFDQVLAQVKRAGITRMGMVDNQKYAKSF
jgi:biopolymer transport protein ExbD